VSVALGFATVLFPVPTFWLIDRLPRILSLSTLLLSCSGFVVSSFFLWSCVGSPCLGDCIPDMLVRNVELVYQLHAEFLCLGQRCQVDAYTQGAFGFFAGFTLLSICLFQKGVEVIQELFQYPWYTIARKNSSETKAYRSKFRCCCWSPWW